MARQAARGTRFVLTRVTLVASVGSLVVGAWSAIALAAARDESATAEAAPEAAAVIEQDGWRWDATLQDWVLIATPVADPAASASQPGAAQPVVVVERQQEVHYVYYVQASPVTTAPLPRATPGSPAARAPEASPATPGVTPAAPGPAAIPVAPDEVGAPPEPMPVDVPPIPVDPGPEPAAIPVLPEPTQEPPVVLPTQPAPVAVPPTPVPPPPPPPPPAPTAPPAPAPAPRPSPPASRGS